MNRNIRIVDLRGLRSALRAIAVVSVIAACRPDPGSSEIARIAESECQILESDLDQAAARHHQLAPAIDEHRLDPDQLQRANADLELSSVGNTAEIRQARLHEFELRFRFCQQIRQVDSKTSSELAVRLEAVHEGLNKNIWSGAMPSAAKTAELLAQLRDLVHEVNALPLKR